MKNDFTTDPPLVAKARVDAWASVMKDMSSSREDEDAFDAAAHRYGGLIEEMVCTPVASLEGVIAKLQCILEGEDAEQIADAAIQDLRRLIGGRSAAP